MKRIAEWLIDSFGSIRGEVVGEDGEFVSAIRTSPVVKREENIVTTRSGSRYELLKQNTLYLSRAEAMDTIDHRIKLLDTPNPEE